MCQPQRLAHMQINRTVLTTLCNRGGLGKSTLFSILAQYLRHQGIPFRGFDLDPDHRSFSRLFPSEVQLCDLGHEPISDAIKVLRATATAAISLVDPRAHLGEHLAEAIRITTFPRLLAESGGRLWIALFPADDLEVLQNIDKVVNNLQADANYVIVHNRARSPQTRMFDGSLLERDILALGSVYLEIPPLLSWARNHHAALEAEHDRGITHLEVVGDRSLKLDHMARLVIEDWLKASFTNLALIAPSILPEGLASVQSDTPPEASDHAVRAKRGAKINRENL